MYSFTVGDRVWAAAEWAPDEVKMGSVREVSENGNAIINFALWSELGFKPDGFSYMACFRIIKHIPKEELDLTRRI